MNRKQIQARARELLEEHTGGIRWGEILKLIHSEAPDTPPNSIHGAIQVLFQSSDDIVKVARGTYQLSKFVDEDAAEAIAADAAVATAPVVPVNSGTEQETLAEQDFYASFADWLEENEKSRWPARWVAAVLGESGAHRM